MTNLSTPDITALILDQHETFRREFARLDDITDVGELARVWGPLALLLEAHADAEEKIFYPELLKVGADADDETEDAISDHNDIRDGVRAAAQETVGSDAWWTAVGKARSQNSDHIAEEEREALPDFRKHADMTLREELGRKFLAFFAEHGDGTGVNTEDKDPDDYIAENS